MRRVIDVALVNCDELHAHQIAVDRGHQPKQAVVLGYGDNAAHRLANLPR